MIRIRKRRITVAITGHRNIYGYDWNNENNRKLIKNIYETIDEFISLSGYVEFIFVNGVALGVDQMVAMIVLSLKQKYLGKFKISLIADIPFKDQPNMWFKKSDINRYRYILNHADRVIYVDSLTDYNKTNVRIGKYHRDKLKIRDTHMLDISDMLLAIYDKNRPKSGTGYCIRNAEKKQMKILYINI